MVGVCSKCGASRAGWSRKQVGSGVGGGGGEYCCQLTSTFMKIFSTLIVFVVNSLVRTSAEAIAARNA